MDSSKTYRKMSDHEIIQGKWKPKVGDVFWDKEAQKLQTLIEINAEHPSYPAMHVDEVWLPRLDDLVEWMKVPFESHVYPLSEYVWVCLVGEEFPAKTYEQSLLQAYMWTQGYKWTGEQWEVHS